MSGNHMRSGPDLGSPHVFTIRLGRCFFHTANTGLYHLIFLFIPCILQIFIHKTHWLKNSTCHKGIFFNVIHLYKNGCPERYDLCIPDFIALYLE